MNPIPAMDSLPFTNSNLFSNTWISRSLVSPFHFNHLSKFRSVALPQFGRPAVRPRHTVDLQDAAATAAVTAGSYVLVCTFDKLVQRQFIQQMGLISSHYFKKVTDDFKRIPGFCRTLHIVVQYMYTTCQFASIKEREREMTPGRLIEVRLEVDLRL